MPTFPYTAVYLPISYILQVGQTKTKAGLIVALCFLVIVQAYSFASL